MHGDWTVSCSVAAGDKTCSLSQVRVNPQTGQRVYGIELQVPASEQLLGAILLPFGLRVSAPVHLKVDDVPLGGDWPFSTCNQFGCFVPATLDTAAIAALSAGETLTVTAIDNAGGKETNYVVSLAGFTSALGRAAELSR